MHNSIRAVLVGGALSLVTGCNPPTAKQSTKSPDLAHAEKTSDGTTNKPVHAGSFGITMGSDPASYSNSSKVDPNGYKIDPPVPNASFDTYYVTAPKQDGICMVMAVTPAISNDAYGNSTISKFDELSAALSKRYGHGIKHDFLQVGSIWNEPKEWTMGFIQNERHLITIWDQDSHAKLPKDIYSVTLLVQPSGSASTKVLLSYKFQNSARCLKHVEDNSNVSL